MAAHWIRVLLDSRTEEKELVAIGGKNNWSLVKINAKSEDQPAERIYATRDRATQIHWIEDHRLGVNYIYVQGPDTNQVELLLRKTLRHYPSKIILQRAHDPKLGPDARQSALYDLALDKMERGFDQETFDIYVKAMRDPDPVVRRSAILGSAYLAWPELAEPLRPLATSAEPDASVRKDAALLVARLDELANKSS